MMPGLEPVIPYPMNVINFVVAIGIAIYLLHDYFMR